MSSSGPRTEEGGSPRAVGVARLVFGGAGLAYLGWGIATVAGAPEEADGWLPFFAGSVLLLSAVLVRVSSLRFAFSVALLAALFPPTLRVAGRLSDARSRTSRSPSSRILRIDEDSEAAQPNAGGDILRSGIYRPHGERGWVHVPGSLGAHRTENFDVSYTIDDRGNRVTPDPAAPRGKVVLLGGSYTFGWGVGDEEGYAWLLGEQHWPEYKIENRACNGWGTAQAWQVVQEELAKEPYPDLILYAWVTLHIGRNYLTSNWLERIAESGAMNPYYELEDDELVFHGVVGPERGLERVGARAMTITLELVEAMHEAAAAKGVPFYVLLLPVREPFENEERFLTGLGQRGIPHLDALHLRDGFPYRTDGHPGRTWHASLAEFLGSAPELRNLMERSSEGGE